MRRIVEPIEAYGTAYNLSYVIFWALIIISVIVVVFAMVREIKARPA
jgi:hypothetical protein